MDKQAKSCEYISKFVSFFSIILSFSHSWCHCSLMSKSSLNNKTKRDGLVYFYLALYSSFSLFSSRASFSCFLFSFCSCISFFNTFNFLISYFLSPCPFLLPFQVQNVVLEVFISYETCISIRTLIIFTTIAFTFGASYSTCPIAWQWFSARIVLPPKISNLAIQLYNFEHQGIQILHQGQTHMRCLL